MQAPAVRGYRLATLLYTTQLRHTGDDRTVDEARAAVVGLRSVDLPGMLAYALAINALAAAWCGEFGEAIRLRAEALATPLRASAALLGDLRRALAWVALALDEDTAGQPAIELAHWAAGDDDLSAAAEAVLARHGVWVHPPRSSRRTSLTRREREVAALAAAGLSSRDIAARLTVSPRTVDSQLARIYSRLGNLQSR